MQQGRETKYGGGGHAGRVAGWGAGQIGRGVCSFECAGNAFPDGFGFFAVLFAALCTQEAFLLALVFALQEFFDFADAHACADPPPPAEEALPEGDGPHEFWHPAVLVLSWDVDKIEGGGEEGEDDGAYAKGGCSAICAPGLTTVDEAAPYDEECGEEEGEGGVADVAGVFSDGSDAGTADDGEELHDCRDDGEGAYF